VIKVSIAAAVREERDTLDDAIADRLDAAPVYRVGKILTRYRWDARPAGRETLSPIRNWPIGP
jgi:RNA-binding protein YhbY